MNILGIDPGNARMGFGVIRKEGSKITLVEAGVIGISGGSQAEKLAAIADGLERLIERAKPERIGIERLFFARNVTTAMGVAEARGIAISVAMKWIRDPELIFEFTPQEVKKGTTNWGGAGKREVARMVALLLGVPKMDIIDDATDALAIAICAANKRTFR